MSLFPRLHKRPENGIYYCRVSVPKDLVPVIGKREVKVSLKTTSLHHAKRLLFPASFQIEQRFTHARGNGTGDASVVTPLPVKMERQESPKSITLSQLIDRYFAAQEHKRLSESIKLDYTVAMMEYA